jgi:hypothetical protein
LDHISTVCFNLLNDLKWPNNTQNLVLPEIKPSWIPEIRIETIDEPSKLKEIKPAGEASKTSQASGTPKTKESRKQVIIYNEGTPVIIRFGYDRK